jgi:hypothetical protein
LRCLLWLLWLRLWPLRRLLLLWRLRPRRLLLRLRPLWRLSLRRALRLLRLALRRLRLALLVGLRLLLREPDRRAVVARERGRMRGQNRNGCSGEEFLEAHL